MYSLNTAEIFDPAAGTFTPTGTMHIGRFNHTATALPDGRVLIIGGQTTDDLGNGNDQVGTTEIFDPASGQSSTWTNLLVPRSSHQAVPLFNGKILVIGGLRGSVVPTDQTEIFDPATRETIAGPLLGEYHARPTATRFASGEVFLFAGSNGAQPGGYGEIYH